MKKLLSAPMLFLLAAVLSISATDKYTYDFQNPDLTITQRVDDLVSRLTLDEKVSQMMNSSPGIPRLGIVPYDHWSEGLHGVARAGVATVFPQVIGLGATWDTTLIYRIADVISTEARAKHHEFVRKNDYGTNKGLTLWSPNINIFRDPRWGRGQETYGEDPFLTSRYGVNFVKGLQGDDPVYFKTLATPKHYAVHSGPESTRDWYDAKTDMYDILDTYTPAFEAAIREGKAYSVMGAYNRVNGYPSCASPDLLQHFLREQWGFKGYVTSDCGAITNIYRAHKYVKTAEEAAAIAVKAGCDLECGDCYKALVNAVKQGLITEKEIDVAVKRIFEARFRLGMFDPLERVGYAQIPYSENDKPEHRKLALEAAEKSIVLLKNKNKILPLKKDLNSILVVGPNADVAEVMYGNYNGIPSKSVTPLEGIREKVDNKTRLLFMKGCELVGNDSIVNEVITEDYLETKDGQKGLNVEYFTNEKLKGKPILTRIEKRIATRFENQTPVVPDMIMEHTSARWSGKLIAPGTGKYLLSLSGDDGFRLYLDNKLIIDKWSDKEPNSMQAVVDFKKGEKHDLRVEYYNGMYSGSLALTWAQQDVKNYKRELLNAAHESDVVVVFAGITPSLEGEAGDASDKGMEGFSGGDRTSLNLPAPQDKLLKLLKACGKPVILVLLNGSAIAVNWANENLDAIVEAWYPGEEGGAAIANVLFGEYNPSGRLPVTFYKSVSDLPDFSDYSMNGRTYRYFQGEPLYPFGFGLSYTTFAYSNLKFPKSVEAGKSVLVSVDVQNTGNMDGGEVAQLYITHQTTQFRVPNLALQGFRYVYLMKSEKKTIQFELHPSQISVINFENIRMVIPEKIEVFVGGSQPNRNISETSSMTKGVLEITGNNFEVK